MNSLPPRFPQAVAIAKSSISTTSSRVTKPAITSGGSSSRRRRLISTECSKRCECSIGVASGNKRGITTSSNLFVDVTKVQIRVDDSTLSKNDDKGKVKEDTEEENKKLWEDLGLRKTLVEGLKHAYPDVIRPTKAQEKFIPSVLEGRDIMLKDDTGSGKSFGIALALLGKPRIKYIGKGFKHGESQQESVTSLVIVPHSNLAHQYLNWIQRIALGSSSASSGEINVERIVQFLTREGQQHLTTGFSTLRNTKPHILISTPQALLDLYKHDPDLIPLQYLSTVVVDEVDYLVETVPKKDSERSFRGSYEKAVKKIKKHPGVTRELLDLIYVARRSVNKKRGQDREEGRESDRYRKGAFVGSGDMPGPQLVLSSATLRTHLSNYLYEESGWLNKDFIVKVKNTGSKPLRADERSATEEARVREAAKTGRVKHSILEVSDTEIKNIEGALKVEANEELEANGELKIFDQVDERHEPKSVIGDGYTERYQNTPSPFNPNALEAIATAVALDVPRIALLVIPSSAPVYRAVYELREMGLDARVLDPQKPVVDSDGGEENPVLLVTTLAMARGLDLPALTHVFSLGIPDGPKVTGRTVDAYLHVAGRVGRFGRHGTVVSVVDAGKEGVVLSDGERMRRILREIGVAPVHFRQFE